MQYPEDSLNILDTYPPFAPSSFNAWSEYSEVRGCMWTVVRIM